MAYFPMFVDLAGKSCLIVGGGSVAARKARTLLEFGAAVKMVASHVGGQVRALADSLPDTLSDSLSDLPSDSLPDSLTERENGGRLRWEERTFRETDLEGAFLVVAATDDRVLNHRIAELAGERGIFADSAADKNDCNFLFPAVVKRGGVVIGITASGNGPAVSAALREKIEACLPETFEEKLRELEELRRKIRNTVESQEERRKIMRKAAKTALETDWKG